MLFLNPAGDYLLSPGRTAGSPRTVAGSVTAAAILVPREQALAQTAGIPQN